MDSPSVQKAYDSPLSEANVGLDTIDISRIKMEGLR